MSMAVPSDGSYDVPGGDHHLVPGHHRRAASTRSSQGLDVPEFSRERINKTVAELQEEREAVAKLGLV